MGILPAVFLASAILALMIWAFTSYYTVTLQSPVALQFQWPFVISERLASAEAEEARADQHGHPLSAWDERHIGQRTGQLTKTLLKVWPHHAAQATTA